jgi:hypothetical protein
MRSTTDRLITLRDGFVLPESVLRWLFDANNRGLTIELHHDKLRVSPAGGVSADDDLFIRLHRDLLKQCVTYINEIAARPV